VLRNAQLALQNHSKYLISLFDQKRTEFGKHLQMMNTINACLDIHASLVKDSTFTLGKEEELNYYITRLMEIRGQLIGGYA